MSALLTRRPATVIALVLTLLLPASPVVAADHCQFVLGFATLKALIDEVEGPDKVGDCLENQWSNPVNGDALQQTTGGLMVWRKLDNWTAFTDGYRTWINGPHGLQARLNTETFDWEASPPPTPTPAPTPVPDYGAWEFHDWTDLLTDVTQERAIVFATERQGYGNELPRLTMRCYVGGEPKGHIYFVWYEHIGQNQDVREGYHLVNYRFDNGSVESSYGVAADNQDATFMTVSFSNKLLYDGHTNLVAEVTRYDGSTIAASWNITGALAAYDKIWDSCFG